MTKKAIVQLSGGLDSATVLAIAQKENYEIFCISFDYEQRHNIELQFAIKRVKNCPAVKEHKIFKIDLRQFGGGALTDYSIEVPTKGVTNEIPSTYVPARNTIFNSISLAYAEVIGANTIFAGITFVDYSGYPDCRPEYIEAFEKMANLATKTTVSGDKIRFITPLLYLSKQDIIKKGIELGVDYENTLSCYNPSNSGLACGVCDSCRIRKEGFLKANIADPTNYKLVS